MSLKRFLFCNMFLAVLTRDIRSEFRVCEEQEAVNVALSLYSTPLELLERVTTYFVNSKRLCTPGGPTYHWAWEGKIDLGLGVF